MKMATARYQSGSRFAELQGTLSPSEDGTSVVVDTASDIPSEFLSAAQSGAEKMMESLGLSGAITITGATMRPESSAKDFLAAGMILVDTLDQTPDVET